MVGAAGWELAVAQRRKKALDDYLQGWPEGAHAEEARRRLANWDPEIRRERLIRWVLGACAALLLGGVTTLLWYEHTVRLERDTTIRQRDDTIQETVLDRDSLQGQLQNLVTELLGAATNAAGLLPDRERRIGETLQAIKAKQAELAALRRSTNDLGRTASAYVDALMRKEHELREEHQTIRMREAQLVLARERERILNESVSTQAKPATVFTNSPSISPAATVRLPRGGERWTNGLGMAFAPVPGTEVLFSIWETRVRDYQAYVLSNKLTWESPWFEQGATHPAVNVGWLDASIFCRWLTEEERKAGRLGSNQLYRLPTDLEWSTAVGLVKEEGATPRERNMKNKGQYPWGMQWPPPKRAERDSVSRSNSVRPGGSLRQRLRSDPGSRCPLT